MKGLRNAQEIITQDKLVLEVVAISTGLETVARMKRAKEMTGPK
jgi:hypothetical protein